MTWSKCLFLCPPPPPPPFLSVKEERDCLCTHPCLPHPWTVNLNERCNFCLFLNSDDFLENWLCFICQRNNDFESDWVQNGFVYVCVCMYVCVCVYTCVCSQILALNERLFDSVHGRSICWSICWRWRKMWTRSEAWLLSIPTCCSFMVTFSWFSHTIYVTIVANLSNAKLIHKTVATTAGLVKWAAFPSPGCRITYSRNYQHKVVSLNLWRWHAAFWVAGDTACKHVFMIVFKISPVPGWASLEGQAAKWGKKLGFCLLPVQCSILFFIIVIFSFLFCGNGMGFF